MATANASRSVSPGAALLRASRMFSMPAPISAPTDLSLATRHKSETATAAFPTHLSVTTPHAARMVGDWGFKRPLPLRTTTKSTFPLVRVKQVDSIEHVTDFQSSSDHAITLRKFQELNINMTVPEHALDKKIAKSVFEEASDITAMSAKDKIELEGTRWKFDGPWLAGMADGEFTRYLTRVVRSRRGEFREHLREVCASEKTERQREEALDAATEAPAPVRASDITEQELTEFLRSLRDDRTQLYRLVSRFLDLAPISNKSSWLASLSHFKPEKGYEMYLDNVWAVNGPPITHPSAGLSYLRTNKFLDNHPVYGPQEYHPPVKSRIVLPKNHAPNYNARLGVAGFIAGVPEGDTSFNVKDHRGVRRNKAMISGLHDFDPEAHGGSKVYVSVEKANIDSKGKLWLKLGDPKPMAEKIQQEMAGEAAAFEDAVMASKQSHVQQFQQPRARKVSRSIMGNSQSYGFGNNNRAGSRSRDY